MRRPSIACQRAVQSLQSPAPHYIWVPDEVLSLAVNRFFQSTCPQQKRHGSNVPGPLEARRRAAKRRMTASAGFYPQDSFPTSFSLGALFGSRSKPQDSWRYEPPSLPKDAPLLHTSSSTWMDNQYGQARSQNPSPDVCSPNHDIPWPLAPRPTTPTAAYDASADLDAVTLSSSTLQATEHTSINTGSIEECLDTFKASLAAAENGRFYVALEQAFRRCLPAAPLVWRYYAAVLQHLHQLGRESGPVLHCLLQQDSQLLRIFDPLQAVGDFAKFLDELDLISNGSSAQRVFAVLARLATKAGRSETEPHDLILLRLIRQINHQTSYADPKQLVSPRELLFAIASKLRSTAANDLLLQHFGPLNRVIRVIQSSLRDVARTPDRSVRVERALLYMPYKDLLELVPGLTSRLMSSITDQQESARSLNVRCLDIWLRMLLQVDVKDDTDKTLLKAAMVSLAKGLRRSQEKRAIAADHFVKALLLHQDLDVEVTSAAERPRFVQELLANVLLQIQTQAKPYTALLDLALPLVHEHGGLVILLRCLRTMEEQKLPLSTRIDLDSILAHELATISSSTAGLSESNIQARAFRLQACEKLANTLSRMGHAFPARIEEIATLSGIRQFNNVLIHARANNALPIAYREVNANLALMERVAMAHQLAHHYSQDTTRTHREVWRSIYYLYSYLRSHSLPIGPLFTKAVVHASIIRPMMEHRFVSARRLIWVCHLVARVEGDEVAARVENRFYAWRGNLIGRAKRVFVGVGGRKQSKAHVATMKRLGLL